MRSRSSRGRTRRGTSFPGCALLVEDAESGIERWVPTLSEAKLVELYDKLLGVRVTPHSPDVESRVRAVRGCVWERKREAHARRFEPWTLTNWFCDLNDISYFEGILDDAVVEYAEERVRLAYGTSSTGIASTTSWTAVDLVGSPPHVAQTWVVVLAYLLMDYRYLYL